MLGKKRKIDSKEIGLDIGLIMAKQMFNTEYLHYGFWPDDLEVQTTNVAEAQEKYAEFLASNIPDGVKTILDVGCGAGKFAQKLLDLGYDVDCVCPSPYLSKHARQMTGNRGDFFECGYEDVETNKTYDMVLFSESFQYIPLEKLLPQTLRFLKKDGYMLICDFFRRDVEGTSPIGGGHDLKKFHRMMKEVPFKIVKEQDITKETAPSMDIVNNFLTDALHPIYDLIFYVLDNNYPKVAKFLRWKFKKKIDKIEFKYFKKLSNAESFAKFKVYYLFLCQRIKE